MPIPLVYSLDVVGTNRVAAALRSVESGVRAHNTRMAREVDRSAKVRAATEEKAAKDIARTKEKAEKDAARIAERRAKETARANAQAAKDRQRAMDAEERRAKQETRRQQV